MERQKNILYVEGMKHDHLSFTKMCDQGHTLNFNAHCCEIRKAIREKV